MTDTYRADSLRVLGPDGAFVAFAKDEDAAKLLVQALNGEDVTATPEPDPWPTAPLIVANWQEGKSRGRGLLVTDGPTPSECYVVLTGDDDYDGYRLLRRGWDGDTLADVVPVTVVPTAEWEALRTARSFFEDGACTVMEAFSALRAAIKATDALGVDL